MSSHAACLPTRPPAPSRAAGGSLRSKLQLTTSNSESRIAQGGDPRYILLAMRTLASLLSASRRINNLRLGLRRAARAYGQPSTDSRPLADREFVSPSTSPLFSPRGEAKCVRSPSVQGARRSAPSGTACRAPTFLNPTFEHGEQAQRSHGGLVACFDRQVVSNAG